MSRSDRCSTLRGKLSYAAERSATTSPKSGVRSCASSRVRKICRTSLTRAAARRGRKRGRNCFWSSAPWPEAESKLFRGGAHERGQLRRERSVAEFCRKRPAVASIILSRSAPRCSISSANGPPRITPGGDFKRVKLSAPVLNFSTFTSLKPASTASFSCSAGSNMPYGIS